MIDNITLSLESLKQELMTYFTNSGLKNVTVFLSLDQSLEKYEIVETKTKPNQIGLPVIVIDAGTTRRQIEQLGDEYGKDYISLSIYIIGQTPIQLVTIGNLIRRKVDTFTFDVLDFSTTRKRILGSATTTGAEFINISNPNTDKVTERYSGIINVTLEVDSESLL